MADISLDVVIEASPERVWSLLFDWERQGEWMLGTKVAVVSGDGASQGSVVEAWTGVGRVGFVDTMVITVWDPPRRCDVLHTGSVVKGTGTFELLELPGERTRFVWSESLVPPLGRLGRVGWPVVRPAFAVGVRRSLAALAALAESSS